MAISLRTKLSHGWDGQVPKEEFNHIVGDSGLYLEEQEHDGYDEYHQRYTYGTESVAPSQAPSSQGEEDNERV